MKKFKMSELLSLFPGERRPPLSVDRLAPVTVNVRGQKVRIMVPRRIAGYRHPRPSKYAPHQGKRECARRAGRQ